ncbi:hypothetical protein SDC9_166533 [bioreactor metagenome]|uniref:Uncharacterized protein n=1 Tax=bioreactor metagenome TaxID=1076179 RepID=A0A645FXB6_9ZZZZ
MTEFLFVFGSDKKFSTFQHGLHHHGCRIGKAHHSFKLQSQVLFSFDVKRNTAYIRLMHRSHYFGHHRKTCSACKCKNFLFIAGHKFVDHRNACRMQKCLHKVRYNVTIVGNGINNPADSRYVDPIKFHLIARGTGSIHDP